MPRYLTVLSIFWMSEQKLDGSEVTRPPVDQHRLGPSERMGAKLHRIKAYAGDPLVNEPRVLSRRQSDGAAATGKEELPGSPSCHPQIVIDCRASLVGQLEPHGPARLFLPDRGSIHRIATRRDVINSERYDITTAEFAVDDQVEQC